MILFKKYRVVLKEDYDAIESLNATLSKANKNLAEDLKSSQLELGNLAALLDTLQEDKEKVIKKYNDVSKRKDKLREQNNELKKELNDIKEQLDIITKEKNNIEHEFAEFKENKFIVKELPSSKPRRTQTMKVKSGARTSKIIKDIKENL